MLCETLKTLRCVPLSKSKITSIKAFAKLEILSFFFSFLRVLICDHFLPNFRNSNFLVICHYEQFNGG